ncbi:hypothetical protein SLS58_010302 [Diplodia intermedia]|uniref:START domain-containing protein n=1 Tax=Diplodia intermedia TaxID=856260 RepID=A0ABR3T6V6_9PEZI
METNYMAAAARSASPSTFTLSKGRNNRLSLLSSGSSTGTGRSVDARSLLTRSPPPSYDGLTGPPVASSDLAGDDRAAHDGGGGRGDGDVSATLDAHLPLGVADKGWAEVESVSKQFLAENLPGWIASMQAESGGGGGGGDHGPKMTATATSPTTAAAGGQQQKQLSQMIKAGVRKGRKGLVLRLLRRTADVNEIVDLRLDSAGAFHGGAAENIKRSVPPDTPAHAASKQRHGAVGEPPALVPVELEARPPATVVHQVPGIHEAPAAPDVFELPTTPATVPRPTVVVPPPPPPPRAADRAATAAAPTTNQAEWQDDAGDGHVSLATSPTESLLRTLSFGPEEASAWSEPVALDVLDTGSDSDHSPPSSIVPTPTKGLSVRHATHRVVKRSRSFGAFAGGGVSDRTTDRTRMLPLDVESLNRRLVESSAVSSSNEDAAGDERRLREDGAVPTGSRETEDAAGGSEAVCHGQKQLFNQSADGHKVWNVAGPRSGQRTAEGSVDGTKIATGNDFAARVDRSPREMARLEPDPTAATSRDAPGREVASARNNSHSPEAPSKLVISTNCGPGSERTTDGVPMPSGTLQGPLAVQPRPPAVLQDNVRGQDSDSHISTHMHEPRDASQGTFDGSVTLPTLIVPDDDDQPDSPGGSLWLPSNVEIRPLPEKRSAAHRFLSHAARATLAQLGRVAAGLYDAYGPEKPVPKDHTCGKELYDDFVERRRGAARELEAYLNRPRAHASPSSNSTNSSFSDSSQIFSGSSTNPSLNPSPATTWGSLPGGDSSPSNGSGSNYSPTALRSNNPFSVRVSALPPPRWLLTCADEGQSVAKLSHVDVTETKIRSDRDLAMAVRGLYAHINRRWWSPLRLRGLASIDFVQFEVHRNRVVDIRKCPDMPPVMGKKTMAHGQQVLYDFEPHDLVPPVGSQYLMHLFRHPEDYESEFITYARAPKRRGARLDVGVGWGVNLVEGFLAERVWLLVMVFFVLGSAVFAVVWACRRGDDVQGAFGVAGWMLTLAALVVGWAQASFG